MLLQLSSIGAVINRIQLNYGFFLLCCESFSWLPSVVTLPEPHVLLEDMAGLAKCNKVNTHNVRSSNDVLPFVFSLSNLVLCVVVDIRRVLLGRMGGLSLRCYRITC